MSLDMLLPSLAPNDQKFELAWVTQASPLRVRIDGQATALPIDVIDWVGGPHQVGDRVLSLWLGARLSVIGKAGGQSGWRRPYTPFSPIAFATAGTLGAVVTAGRYRVDGSTCHVNYFVNIVDAGTASGLLYLSLPLLASTAIRSAGGGIENTTGWALTFAQDDNSWAYILTASSATIIATGRFMHVSLTYEIA